MPLPVSEFARLLGLNYQGDGTRIIHEVRGWQAAGPASLVFCDSIERAASLPETLPCGCIILQPEAPSPDGPPCCLLLRNWILPGQPP